MIDLMKKHQFLFEELVKRDFKKKYKRTILGMGWSILSPLLSLLVMRVVFTVFFGEEIPHYTTYLYCGNMVFAFFNESSTQGMTALLDNAPIFSKVNVPKYLFLLAKNAQTLLNFSLTLIPFLVLCFLDRVPLTWKWLFLIYPILCMLLFNVGVGLTLSALYVFFRDMRYLWTVFIQLLMYASAIFYPVDRFPAMMQKLFLLNPIYLFIRYFRGIVIDGAIPSVRSHMLMMGEAAAMLIVGGLIYKKYNTEFLYYV